MVIYLIIYCFNLIWSVKDKMINSNSLFKELGLPESPVVEGARGGGDYYEDFEQDPSVICGYVVMFFFRFGVREEGDIGVDCEFDS